MSIKVEVFSSPGCSKCAHARAVLQRLIGEIGANAIQWREVNILEELDHAVGLGVLSTPAVAIDGELVFTTLPSAGRLRRELEARLAATARTGKT